MDSPSKSEINLSPKKLQVPSEEKRRFSIMSDALNKIFYAEWSQKLLDSKLFGESSIENITEHRLHTFVNLYSILRLDEKG